MARYLLRNVDRCLSFALFYASLALTFSSFKGRALMDAVDNIDEFVTVPQFCKEGRFPISTVRFQINRGLIAMHLFGGKLQRPLLINRAEALAVMAKVRRVYQHPQTRFVWHGDGDRPVDRDGGHGPRQEDLEGSASIRESSAVAAE